MKNKYTRLKWLAAIIFAIALYFLVMPLRAAPLNSNSIYLLQQEVRGVVTDQEGMPLPGVTITVKGKNRGTVTDIDGNYAITISPEDILIFSFIGFQTFEEPVLGRREIMIRLEEDISSLGEVQINAGYYNTTKRESTGNISRVTAEEIELQPVISPLQALQGRMAGVEIIPGGNQPGMASTIRIRGQNSLRREGNLPLYIIDGVPIIATPLDSYTLLGFTGIDPLNTINLSNIESIEVLKDADATAIYGSRAANGVILITTKKGIDRKTGIEARVYTGASTFPNRVELLNTQQYLQLRNQAFVNDGVEPTSTNAFDLLLWDQNKYTDWQELFFGGTSSVKDVNLSTSGGNEFTFYRFGGSFHKQGTVHPGDSDYQKVTANLNLNHLTENKKLSIDLSVNYGVDNNRLLGYGELLYQAFNLPPNAPQIFKEDGSLHWENWAEAGRNNPLEGFHSSSQIQANNMVSSLGISYQIFKGLGIKTNAGYTHLNSEELLKNPKRSFNPSSWENINHRSSHRQSNRSSWILEPQIFYNKIIGEGELEALIGATFQENKYRDSGIHGEGYVSESQIGNLNSAEDITNAISDNSDYRYNAIFGRFGFNWSKKYFINLTGRRDGSSRFGPGNKIANFGAVGGAWIFSEESIFKNDSSFISFGKIRGSLGTTGNDQIGDYGYLDAYESTKGPGGLYPTQLSNPDYSWEVNKKIETAVELGFFKDRLNLSLSWYRNRSSNQLVGYPLPATTGFTSVQANLPATVQNTGWEVEWSSLNFNTVDFQWRTSFNMSFPKNELVSYPNIDQSSHANTYRVGSPLNISLLYEYKGLDPETGYYTIADVNEDGRFDYEDRMVIHDQGRKYFGGLSNNIEYKNFSLQFLWEFVKQEGSLILFNPGGLGMQREEAVEALTDGSRYQRISQSSPAYNAYTNVLSTTLPIVDASFIRLRTLSIGYSIPEIILHTTGLRDGKIFLNGQNLFTLTDYKGLDPEMPNGGTQYASLRTITAGIQLIF